MTIRRKILHNNEWHFKRHKYPWSYHVKLLIKNYRLILSHCNKPTYLGNHNQLSLKHVELIKQTKNEEIPKPEKIRKWSVEVKRTKSSLYVPKSCHPGFTKRYPPGAWAFITNCFDGFLLRYSRDSSYGCRISQVKCTSPDGLAPNSVVLSWLIFCSIERIPLNTMNTVEKIIGDVHIVHIFIVS